MGHKDIDNLHPIYRACFDFTKLAGFNFQFKEDSGDMETSMLIDEYGNALLNSQKGLIDIAGWRLGTKIFVPDIMDFKNKIIIEFEETYTKKKKGHDPDGADERTSTRDIYYGLAKFRFLKIFDYEFENEKLWKAKLFRFLIDCHENKLEVLA